MFFIQFAILLCAGTFVSGISVRIQNNGPVKSPGATQQQDHLALPSQDAYQNIAAPANKYLPTSAPSYQVNSAVVDTISEGSPAKQVPVQYGSPKVQQPTHVTISASVASDPSSPEYNNILERYAPAVDPIRPYFASPVAAKTVSVGSQQVQQVQQIQQVHQIQQVANAGSVQGAGADVGYITRPFVVYTNNAAQSGQYFAVPTAQTVEAQRTVQIHPQSSQNAQYGAPVAVQPTNSPPKPFYPPSSAILESHGAFRAQSPAAPAYELKQIQTASPAPPPQYLPAQKVAYNVNPTVKTVSAPVPVAQKQVTIEAYNSVASHPPPAPKYAPSPIPIPVIFQQLETNSPADQQFVLAQPVGPTGATYAQVPIGVQAIPVPVYATNAARVQYQHIPVTGGHQQGYAKAVLFSPASEVSRVIFNGLGVSYGW